MSLLTRMSRSLSWPTIPARAMIALLCFGAAFYAYLLRAIVSVSVIPIKNQYHWDEKQCGTLLSSFFYGYTATQIHGGIWSKRYGERKVLGLGMLLSAFFTLLFPYVSNAETFIYALICQVMVGLSAGVIYPAIHGLLAHWVPPEEKSRFATMTRSGGNIGTIFGLQVASVIIQYDAWQTVFTVTFGIGILWCIWWYLKGFDDPSSHPTISPAEYNYIMDAIATKDQALPIAESNDESGEGKRAAQMAAKNEREEPTPWLKFFKSPAVWAIIIAQFAHNWGYFILLSWLPTYFKNVFGMNVKESALLTALPQFLMFLSVNASGWVADYAINRLHISVTRTRKYIQLVGFLGPAVCMLLLCLVGPSGSHETDTGAYLMGDTTRLVVPGLYFAVFCMCASFTLCGFSTAGYCINHLDISPKYAAILQGIGNGLGTIPGIVGISVVGYILDATNGNWSAVFAMSVFWYLVGTVSFTALATGERVEF